LALQRAISVPAGARSGTSAAMTPWFDGVNHRPLCAQDTVCGDSGT
jgi:hypothetical protein